MLNKLHEEQTAEIAVTALGGAVHGVLTEHRAFPAHDHLSYEETANLPCAALTAYNGAREFCRQVPPNAAPTASGGNMAAIQQSRA
ncbi:hypothetical protein K438DRAFT_1969155 [Mycena galopus ATCC 62051]|nr:hypothetical protein K438DRAFT_1969155 [Mycena galopus ATCC 62051]